MFDEIFKPIGLGFSSSHCYSSHASSVIWPYFRLPVTVTMETWLPTGTAGPCPCDVTLNDVTRVMLIGPSER